MAEEATTEDAVITVEVGDAHHQAVEEILQILTNKFVSVPDAAAVLVICSASVLSAGDNAEATAYNSRVFIDKLHELLTTQPPTITH